MSTLLESALGTFDADWLKVEGGRTIRLGLPTASQLRAASALRTCRARGLPYAVADTAFYVCCRAQKLSRRPRPLVPLAVLVAARLHGIYLDPRRLCSRIGPGHFAIRASKLAVDLGLVLPQTNHDVALLRLVDSLGLGRETYFKVKELYPKARTLRGGNPRTTLGALLYLVARRKGLRLTHGQVAVHLGLSTRTIWGASESLREVCEL
ncbi:MAG: hypothetical protein JRN23_04295 [Nitrososphaerota archaeon]|nr:hypothetical protein [Nitrososphaerota archaeon]